MADYKLKLKALLHDPPDKFLHLKSHEKIADELFKNLFTETPHVNEAILADRLASALSRIIVAPNFDDENKRNEFEKVSQVIDLKEAEFIDIFSEQKSSIESPQSHEEVKNLFENLGKLTFQDQQERAKFIFLFFWRFLPEIFPWIDKHPADTRAPNHSIYDHLVQTSAIVSALPKPAFLLFTISPVQEFISKARKTSDLWAGSYMLSYFIYKCIEVVMEKLGPDNVIFPNLLGQPTVDRWLYEKFKGSPITQSFSNENYFRKFIDNAFSDEKLTIANFPNRFLAIIPYDNSLAKEVEEAFRNELEEISEKVCDEILKSLKDEKQNSANQNQVLKNQILSQIKNHLFNYFQAYWVVLPWTNDTQNYSPNEALEDYGKLISNNNELYQTVQTIINHPYYKPANVGSAYSLLLELTEKLLGARKSIRNVLKENYYESRGEKCHLCGEFEVLDIDWNNLRKNKPELVKEGERLCGVCITKRLFPEIIKEKFILSDPVKFPSTSEMASIGGKRRLNDSLKNDLKNKIEPFLNKYPAIPKTISVPKLKNDPLYNIDGQFLMEETYRADYFEKEYGVKVSENDFKDILETLRKYNINPSKYYAILQMDGDNMGKWLKGEFNPKIKDTIHPKVVDALISYSEDKELKRLLFSKHPNSPSIHQAFSRRLSQFAIEEVRKIVEDEHYGKLIYAGGDDILAFLPIEEVLSCAYDLQINFKKVLSPKASMSAGIVIVHHKYPLYLALKEVRDAEKMAKKTFQKDAFCIRVISHSGEIRDAGGKWELIKFIEDLICKFRNEQIPSTFAKEFSEVYESEKIENKELLKVELKRIYFRKRVEDKDYINKIIEQFENYNFDVKYFVNLFLISKFLSREVRI
ncbi:type III-B CRISPR-associated protein Cas10/Cmr2 [Candidatus Chrysopegis kryptomonas]|uniref:CRISPR-associated protein Cmr2 n=2 Tax=Bacteria TaxID=2 RepID=A0A0P1P1T7_9BACT|nr:type III-B CRISPR-associated protein Cas10/Cmr2 [Candidatus Chrysopegis kryptomonas]CUT04684.1 CRISPR-associated protein Cmr2 [Candidatus Chrysopegis kryptomonas]